MSSSRELAQTVGGVREPHRRVSLAKVERVLAQRLSACREAADMYAERAIGTQRDFYLRMSATERCAATEILHCLELICGPDARDRSALRDESREAA